MARLILIFIFQYCFFILSVYYIAYAFEYIKLSRVLRYNTINIDMLTTDTEVDLYISVLTSFYTKALYTHPSQARHLAKMKVFFQQFSIKQRQKMIKKEMSLQDRQNGNTKSRHEIMRENYLKSRRKSDFNQNYSEKYNYIELNLNKQDLIDPNSGGLLKNEKFWKVFVFAYLFIVIQSNWSQVLDLLDKNVKSMHQRQVKRLKQEQQKSTIKKQTRKKSILGIKTWDEDQFQWKKIIRLLKQKQIVRWQKIMVSNYSNLSDQFLLYLLNCILNNSTVTIRLDQQISIEKDKWRLQDICKSLKVSIYLKSYRKVFSEIRGQVQNKKQIKEKCQYQYKLINEKKIGSFISQITIIQFQGQKEGKQYVFNPEKPLIRSNEVESLNKIRSLENFAKLNNKDNEVFQKRKIDDTTNLKNQDKFSANSFKKVKSSEQFPSGKQRFEQKKHILLKQSRSDTINPSSFPSISLSPTSNSKLNYRILKKKMLLNIQFILKEYRSNTGKIKSLVEEVFSEDDQKDIKGGNINKGAYKFQ